MTGRRLLVVAHEPEFLPAALGAAAAAGAVLVHNDFDEAALGVPPGAELRSFASLVGREPLIEQNLEWLTSWRYRPLDGGRTLVDLATFDEFSAWWLLDPEMGLNWLGPTSSVVLLQHVFTRLLAAYPAAPIELYSNDPVCAAVAKTVCQRAGRPLSIRGSRRRRALRGYRPLVGMAMFYLQIAGRWLLSRRAAPRTGSRPRLVFLIGDRWQKFFSTRTRDFAEGDPNVGGVLELLRESYDVRVNLMLQELQFRPLRHGGERPGAFEQHWSLADIPRTIGYMRFTRRLWRRLSRLPAFDDFFAWRGVPHPLIKRRLKWHLLYWLPAFMTYLDVAGRCLDRDTPSAVAMTAEMTPFKRALILQSRRRGIPTIAIQHGLVALSNLAFSYRPGDVAPGAWKSPHVPLPDVTAVYGAYFARYMQRECHYAASMTEVTGAAVFDGFAAKARHEAAGVGARVGVRPGERVIVLATTTVVFKEEKTRLIMGTLRAAAQLPDVFVIIKLHPGERSADEHHAIAKELGVTRYAVVRDEHVHDVIAAGEILVTTDSTVVIEALGLDRFAVIYDPMQRGIHRLFDESPAIAAATDEASLTRTLRALLFDPEERARMIALRARHTTEFLGPNDGRAAERVAALIDRMARARASAGGVRA